MRHVGAEVAAHDAVPGGVVLLVELLLDEGAMSFSMLYFSRACVAQSTASCCMSSAMSAFLITALRSVILAVWCFAALQREGLEPCGVFERYAPC